MLLFDHKVTKNKWKYLHLSSVISALVLCNLSTYAVGLRPPPNRIASAAQSDCVRRPIRLRSPPNQIASATQSDCVRCTMKKCGVEYIRSATSTVSFLSTWAAQWCPLRGTGSRRWLSRALLRGWLPRHSAVRRRLRVLYPWPEVHNRCPRQHDKPHGDGFKPRLGGYIHARAAGRCWPYRLPCDNSGHCAGGDIHRAIRKSGKH